MAEEEESSSPIRETAREIRKDLSPARLDERLSDALSDRPVLRHAMDLRVFGLAVLIAVAATIVVALLISPKLAALVLLVGLFGGWALLARRSYHRRRPTAPADQDD